MEVDANAPAVARASIDIAAPAEVAWNVLTDIPSWPTWNPDVKSATLAGPLAAGTTFRWRAGPGTINSTLQSVEPPHAISWTGRTLGITAIHVYRLERTEGGTRVTSEESWDGLPVRLLRGWMTRSLQKSSDLGLDHLKAEAERRVASASTG